MLTQKVYGEALKYIAKYWDGLCLFHRTGLIKSYDEQITIVYEKDQRYVGESNAIQDNQEKEWAYDGFQRGDILVFSYLGKNDNTWYSIGNITLKNAGKVFVGEWTGKTCNGANVVKCPYILSINSEKDLVDYKHLLKKKNCQIFNRNTFEWDKYTDQNPVPCAPPKPKEKV